LQQNYYSKKLLAEFNKNNIDLVIISDYKHDSHLAGSLFVYQETMLLALPENHPARAQEKIDLNTVVDLPLYWCKRYQNPALYDQMQKIISQLPTPLVLQQKLHNFLTMLMEIAMGREWCIKGCLQNMSSSYQWICIFSGISLRQKTQLLMR
jgi:LysR family transcriptional regulator, benzoate and cis,cis-muconate-responsive activator of ben and cat genes